MNEKVRINRSLFNFLLLTIFATALTFFLVGKANDIIAEFDQTMATPETDGL